MIQTLEKLSLRKTDYIAMVGDFDGFSLSSILKSASGMVVVGDVNKKMFSNLRDVRSLEHEAQLDEDAFDKILINYSDDLELYNLYKAADHFGLVLITNVPFKVAEGYEKTLNAWGIYETWRLNNNFRTKGTCDLLFKVRK